MERRGCLRPSMTPATFHSRGSRRPRRAILEEMGPSGGRLLPRSMCAVGRFASWGRDLLALSPAHPVKAGWDRRRFAGGGAVAQTGSAPRSHRGGQGFKSPQLHPVQGPFPVVGGGLFRSCTAVKCSSHASWARQDEVAGGGCEVCAQPRLSPGGSRVFRLDHAWSGGSAPGFGEMVDLDGFWI